MTDGARQLLALIKSLSRQRGYAFMFQKTMAERQKCTIRTLQRRVRELRDAGIITVKKRQHSSAVYTVVEKPVEIVVSGVVSGVASGRGAYKELSFTPELERAARLPARKPPSKETELYRTAFAEEWTRTGTCFHPGPAIMPVLADSARMLGLQPGPAILSLDRAIASARERVIRARNPEGLIIHIARETWKAG